MQQTRWRVTRSNSEPQVEIVEGRLSSDGILSVVAVIPGATQAPGIRFDKRLAEWIPTVAVLGGLIYLALRLPTSVFYQALGVTPEEVGLGPDVLVPQSGALLLLVGVLTGVFYVGLLTVNETHDTARSIATVWTHGNKRAAANAAFNAAIAALVAVVVGAGIGTLTRIVQ